MKKKKLLARVTALTLAAILMVPSSIGTTVLASPDNTEASAEAPGSDEASDKAEGTVQESASADKSADGGQTPESHVIRQIKRCLLHQIKTGFTEHLTMV